MSEILIMEGCTERNVEQKKGYFHMKAQTLKVLFIVVLLLVSWSVVSEASLIDVLDNHVDIFIDNQYPGAMTCTVTEYETISGGSDLDALADLITLNFCVIDQDAGEFVAITGPDNQRQQYIDEILMPKMATSALVAQLDWIWSGLNITEYALVSPDATVGDCTNILEGIAGWYRMDPPSANYDYHNGFGMHVAHFEASIECEEGEPYDLCIPHRWQWASLPGDNAIGDHKSWCCVPCKKCIMDVAFVGYTGFPSVNFNAKDFQFEVSGWGWQWHNSHDRLTTHCECVPEPSTLLLLGFGVAGLLGFRRRLFTKV